VEEVRRVNPQFTKTALMPLFLRSDGDWSFVAREKGWSDKYDSYIYAFIFDKEKIAGRQAEFAAKELLPVMRRHLEMAVQQAPTRVFLERSRLRPTMISRRWLSRSSPDMD